MKEKMHKENTLTELYDLSPADRIRYLAKEKNVNLKDVSTALGVDQIAFLSWLSKRDLPPINYLNAIADYFDVDLRFIITGKHEEKFTGISEEEKIMLKNYNNLSGARQAEIRFYIEKLLKAEMSDTQSFKIKQDFVGESEES